MSGISRAERFEDEKKRIIESCFTKVDANQQVAESYITHIRITEDAHYPSAPPPPDSNPDNKKQRLIIIAVRSTGRVRMHKARENANGSFSIGKTWNLEELSSIESFSHSSVPPPTEKEVQQKQWAGSTGFIVTITKPYFWQANTSKEKDFFIASAVKIYRKYTKGQVFELKGFDEPAKAQMLGLPPGASPPQPTQGPPPPVRLADRQSPSPGPPQPVFARRDQSRDDSRYRASPGPPASMSDQQMNPPMSPMHPPMSPRRVDTESPSPMNGLHAPQRPFANPEHVRSGSPLKQQSRAGTSPAPPPIAASRTPTQSGFPPVNQNPSQTRPTQVRSESSPKPPSSRGPTPTAVPSEPARAPSPARPPKTPTESKSPIATSAISDATVDLNDAATVGALTGYFPPGSGGTAASQQPSREPSSPPAPERSSRRPTIEGKVNDDLRPSPLSPPKRQGMTSAPRDMAIPPDAPSLDSAADFGEGDDEHRPGLGPMIKKNAARDRFRKAATAATAFKPRPGGAAEKILKAKEEREAGLTPGPDGISGVVPRPQPPAPAKRPEHAPVMPAPLQPSYRQDDLAVRPLTPRSPTGPQVEITSPSTPMDFAPPSKGVELRDEAPSRLQTPEQKEEEAAQAAEVEPERQQQAQEEQKERLQAATKVKKRNQKQIHKLMGLGVDHQLLDGKALDFESVLEDYGWAGEHIHLVNMDRFEGDLRREVARLEAGAWLSNDGDGSREESVTQVESLFDKCISECDELDGLLTLYNAALSSLEDDIRYIEAQSQGLQVQSANQKLLQTELQNLLGTMSLGRDVMQSLRQSNLDETKGLLEIESSLERLYQALVMIDPSIRAPLSERGREQGKDLEDTLGDYSQMKVVREKREAYFGESDQFCQRLIKHLDLVYTKSFGDAKRIATSPISTAEPHLNRELFQNARKDIWRYGPELLYLKMVNQPAWTTLLRIYHSRAQPLYSDAFAHFIAGQRKTARKTTGEESELLFTNIEKDDPASGGAASMGLAAARKLTVKRSQTLAKSLRNAAAGETKSTSVEARQTGATKFRSEVFAIAMNEMAPLISMEQNFIVDSFHATSFAPTDFLETLRAQPPDRRLPTNLLGRRPIEPDREIAKRVHGVMTDLFSTSFAREMNSLLDWVLSADPIQGVGVLASLSKHAFYLNDGSQEYLVQIVDTMSSKLENMWTKFVDEQVKAIDETKVKIKKRKGVIGFIKVFPHFSSAVENIFSAVAEQDYDGPADTVVSVRRLVDAAYARINRAMFDSLKVIAKASPTAAAQAPPATKGVVMGGTEDAEDKEILNYYILIIENMNHYVEEVEDGGREGVLAEWRGRAMMERAEAMDAYVGRVLKRPLGKLIDYLDSVSSLQSTTAAENTPSLIANRPTFSRKAARNLLAGYDGKEIRRGIETLRKRIEKHFGDADDPNLSRNLVNFVSKECERGFEKVLERTQQMVQDVYPQTEGEKPVSIDFSSQDIQSGFRR